MDPLEQSNLNKISPSFWSVSVDDLMQNLQTSPQGLTREDARLRLVHFGENLLRPKRRSNNLLVLVSQFKWKEKEVDVQSASVKKAKIAVELAEAERDLARVSKLIEQNVASAQKYNLSDFKAKVDKKDKEYQQALSTEKKKTTEAKNLKAEYEKMSK